MKTKVVILMFLLLGGCGGKSGSSGGHEARSPVKPDPAEVRLQEIEEKINLLKTSFENYKKCLSANGPTACDDLADKVNAIRFN